MIRDFALPDLGEGLTESEIIQWHVAVGDTVTLNQPLAEVETAKAIVQLPSPFAGVIAELCAEPGSTVAVGTRIVAFEVGGESPERNSVLVGYGPAVETGERPKRKARASVAQSGGREPVAAPSAGHAAPSASHATATPPVRKLAHDLGVDLSTITGTGEDGLVTRADVTAAASAHPGPATDALSDEAMTATRTPIRGVRKATAAAMVASAFTAPHVTEFLTVDVTRTVELVARIRERGDSASMLAVVAKVVCLAAQRTPSINSSWDGAADEIVEYRHLNLGIAVATERGLLVPNIANAHSLTLGELSDAISELARTAREGRTAPAAFSGGTMTISNVGVFGIDAGTPILNPGEAAILATGAIRRQPWEFEGEVALREVMTLSLSFDHRLVDGEQGARFLVDVGSMLADPATVLAIV